VFQRFFEEVSHKTPPTHNESGAFFLCLPHEIKSIFHCAATVMPFTVPCSMV